MPCPYCAAQSRSVMIGDAILYHADCRAVLSQLEAESVSTILTDPPYATGANSLLGRLRPSSEKYQNSDSQTKFPELDNDSLLPEAWQELMSHTFRELFRVAKAGADLLVFCDWRSFSSMVGTVGANRWHLKGALPWDKGRGSRPQKNGFRSQSELILWARKPGSLERTKDVYLDGAYSFRNKGERFHMTPKPIELMEALLQIAPTGGTILDPFMGSAPVGVAAMNLGLRYIGIESVEAYFDAAVKRLSS